MSSQEIVPSSSLAPELDPSWMSAGGRAINEKIRVGTTTDSSRSSSDPPSSSASSTSASSPSFDPLHIKAHLYHALEGLERYPHYLSKWNEPDMDRLAKALQHQLNQVQQQQEAVRHRRALFQALVHDTCTQQQQWSTFTDAPTTWEHLQERNIFDPRTLACVLGSTRPSHGSPHVDGPPDLAQVLTNQATLDLETSRLTELMDEECFDVFALPVLSEDFCQQLRGYVQALIHHGQAHPERYGALSIRTTSRPVFPLEELGLAWLNDLLFHLLVRPISRQLFQSSESLGDLDWRHGYILTYEAAAEASSSLSPSPRVRDGLVAHTDDAEVTLNVGLGPDFTGGQVEFLGERRPDGTGGRTVHGSWTPLPGRATLHAGRHFHRVTPVTSGSRWALILWCRSWRGVRSSTCPCCWLNRRLDRSCCCGPSWN